MPGLGSLGTLRLPPSLIDGERDPDDLSERYAPLDVDLSDDDGGIDRERSQKIEMADGSVIVWIGPRKIPKEDVEFGANLAEVIPESTLNGIADQMLRLIEQDNESRREWLDTRARGMELMGLRIEAMRSNGADGSSPLEGMSQVRATLLAEAVIRFGANAFSELCPTDGPAKITEDSSGAWPALDDLADALEHDLNHYLTVVDKPWVPDTDQMLLRVGLDGCVFKKVYHDPILRRPISRAVYGDDLIVNNGATSVYDAGRITHRVFMRPSMVRRMQLVGAYRDIDLYDPGYIEKYPTEIQAEQISGIRRFDTFEQEDRDHEFFESYCELDLPGFEHETDNKPDGLAVPYKVVIHKETRAIMEIRRNWNEDDELCLPKTYFVQYPFIRGFGFYAIGLSHLLGNMTNGITAAYREIVDAGMFSNFPGLIIAKGAARQNNNIFRVPPGGSAEIETGGLPINQVVMGMPYKTPDAVFTQFIDALNSQGKSLGGTAEIMVGEGRQDAPVGTTLALIEQAIKPLLATHKRLCAAQSDELQLLCDRLREDPAALWRFNKRPYARWDDQLVIQALNSNEIVTRADPNTASHVQRMLRNAALYQMAKDDPSAFNVVVIRRTCIRGIGFANPDNFLNSNPQPPPPDPKAQAAQLGAQADMLDAQTRAQQLQLDQQNQPLEMQRAQLDSSTKIQTSQMNLHKQQLATKTAEFQAQNEARKPQMEAQKQAHEGQQAELDRRHEQVMQMRELAHAQSLEQGGWAHEERMSHQEGQRDMLMDEAGRSHEMIMGDRQRQFDAAMGDQDRQQEQLMGQQAQAHEAQMGARDQQYESMREERGRQHEVQLGEQEHSHEAQMGARSEAHEERMGMADRRERMAETRTKAAATTHATPQRTGSLRGSNRERKRTSRQQGGSVTDDGGNPPWEVPFGSSYSDFENYPESSSYGADIAPPPQARSAFVPQGFDQEFGEPEPGPIMGARTAAPGYLHSTSAIPAPPPPPVARRPMPTPMAHRAAPVYRAPVVPRPMRQMRAQPAPTAYTASAGRSGASRFASGGAADDDFMHTPFGVAHRAPDGFHYIQHPRTGQFFKITRRS